MATKGQSTVKHELHSTSGGVVPELDATVESVTIDGVVEITVSTGIKANVGNYESKDTFGSIKGKFSEGTDPASVSTFLFDRLYEVLSPELEIVQDLVAKKDKPGSVVNKL